MTNEKGFQPSQRDVSDFSGGQSVQEDVMRDMSKAALRSRRTRMESNQSQMPSKGHL